MKMKQWYQRHDRVSDEKASTGTDRASYHAQEPIEDDDERLAMRQGDMLYQCLNELPVREFEKTEQYKTSSRTRKRCTVPPAKTPTQEHGLMIVEVSSHSP